MAARSTQTQGPLVFVRPEIGRPDRAPLAPHETRAGRQAHPVAAVDPVEVQVGLAVATEVANPQGTLVGVGSQVEWPAVTPQLPRKARLVKNAYPVVAVAI